MSGVRGPQQLFEGFIRPQADGAVTTLPHQRGHQPGRRQDNSCIHYKCNIIMSLYYIDIYIFKY